LKLPAQGAGPFDRTHGSELVEEFPGHAVASRMRAKEVYFIRCPSCLPEGRDPEGHAPVKSVPGGEVCFSDLLSRRIRSGKIEPR